MGKFNGILICTDLDGTLLKNDGTISTENLNAIEYFKQEGGIFTFITGRMPFFVSHIHNAINPNAPFGCINGGGLYDYNEKKYIWTAPMAEGVNVLIEHIDKEFPNVGIQVNTFEHTYFCKENETMKYFRRITGLPNLVQNYNDITETVSKIIFGSEDEEELLAVEKALRTHLLAQNFDFVRSEKVLFEILPNSRTQCARTFSVKYRYRLDRRYLRIVEIFVDHKPSIVAYLPAHVYGRLEITLERGNSPRTRLFFLCLDFLNALVQNKV
jgi:HAD superfamily hydrolase (TIGR01484 family)